jgi:hypothetical protein
VKPFIVMLLGAALLVGCRRQPSEEKVYHRNPLSSDQWLRSEYEIVGRETKEFDDHSGDYLLLTIKHGNETIKAECGVTWRSTTGEEFPSTLAPNNHCNDLPMGFVKLERTDWNTLYYFAGSGQNREEITLPVRKVETH